MGSEQGWPNFILTRQGAPFVHKRHAPYPCFQYEPQSTLTLPFQNFIMNQRPRGGRAKELKGSGRTSGSKCFPRSRDNVLTVELPSGRLAGIFKPMPCVILPTSSSSFPFLSSLK
jgi:hypothetical protein